MRESTRERLYASVFACLFSSPNTARRTRYSYGGTQKAIKKRRCCKNSGGTPRCGHESLMEIERSGTGGSEETRTSACGRDDDDECGRAREKSTTEEWKSKSVWVVPQPRGIREQAAGHRSPPVIRSISSSASAPRDSLWAMTSRALGGNSDQAAPLLSCFARIGFLFFFPRTRWFRLRLTLFLNRATPKREREREREKRRRRRHN